MTVHAFVRLFPSVLALAALAALGARAQQPSDTSAAHTVYAVPVVAADTPRVRRHAVAYSDAYNTRLTIHRIGSYTMLPLFAGEWLSAIACSTAPIRRAG